MSEFLRALVLAVAPELAAECVRAWTAAQERAHTERMARYKAIRLRLEGPGPE